MKNLYHILFKIFLLLPIIGIISSNFLNKYLKIQKIINNSLYISMSVLCIIIMILFTIYGKYDVTLLNINRNMPIIFSTNSINLIFGLFLSIIIIFLNINFQNSFNYLKLLEKYQFYNSPIACLYFLYFLLSFSNNILITLLFYILIILYSLFLIVNPDLKDFRKTYSINFSVSLVSFSILIIFSAFYLFYNENILFILQDVKKLNEIPVYLILSTLFLLILINFVGPIYIIFKEKIYYEDLLTIVYIHIIPFLILNTFIFTKLLYYTFYNNFSNLGLYFYYIGYFIVVLFCASCFFLIKYIKYSRKFTLLFIFSNFLIFLSQFLFINTKKELIIMFSNFLMLMLSSVISILAYSSILFLLFNIKLNETNILYKKSKIELNFYIFCSLLPIFVNFISYFNLNFHNFNVLYLINLIEIFIIFCIYGVYIFLITYNQTNSTAKDYKNISQIQIIRYFAPQIIFLLLFLFILLFKGQITKFILFYK